MSDDENNLAGNFACHVEVNQQHESAFARLHVASQDIVWDGNPVTIEYLSLYLTLKVEGSEFDLKTLRNTSNVAKDGVVNQKFIGEKVHQEGEKAGVHIGVDAKGPQAKINLEVNEQQNSKVAKEVEGQFEDLMWNLENFDKQSPKWKISQKNQNSLVLSLSDKMRLGKFARMDDAAEICITGHASTGSKGIGFRVIMNNIPKKYKYLGGENFWRQIIERRIEKCLLGSKIPITQVMV